ncbi:ATP-binding protein [Streptomyces sp. PSRA5]|uniref:ATP-binding protein n=1 Tax=Streptomyces panacea TaxID=3035064 RepID=UPI00339CAD59
MIAAVAAFLIGRVSTAEWRQALAGGCAALTVLLLAWVLALYRRLGAERADRDRERRTAAARGAEVAHLAAVRVPAIVERVRAGRRLDGVPGPVAPEADTGEDFARALASVVAALGSDEGVRRERGLRDSVQTAFESVARNMHAMATVQQRVLDHVERAIDDPRLMADVMKADHAASQMTRKAQTLLVMCGIWPARRESQPVSLYDCVRGAQSRIVEFGRVEVHGGQTLFVVPPAVEGLMHAIAELLENATVFSPSRTQVIVTIREVGAGAVVEIDDAGLGMPPDVLHQAMSQLRDELDLTRLGAVPRLGLACVGRWCREMGFNVELTGASAYGGTRAVTFVPHRLLTEPLSHFPAEPVPVSAGASSAGDEREHERTAAAPVRAEDGPGGLPRRRSRRRDPATAADQDRAREQAPQASRPQPPQQAQPDPAWTPEAARASITSVVSGSRRGRAAAVQDSEVPDQHDGGRQ